MSFGSDLIAIGHVVYWAMQVGHFYIVEKDPGTKLQLGSGWRPARPWIVVWADDPTQAVCDFETLDDALRCADEIMLRLPEVLLIGNGAGVAPEMEDAANRWFDLMREHGACTCFGDRCSALITTRTVKLPRLRNFPPELWEPELAAIKEQVRHAA